MITTIDAAGRLVVPKEIREKAGLTAGTPIEIFHDGTSIRIERAVPSVEVVRMNGRLVARPSAGSGVPEVDVPALVSAERERWPG